MHIGVDAQGFISWGGGVGFIENLLFGLASVQDKEVMITVFVPEQPARLRMLASRVKSAILQPSKAMQHLCRTTQNLESWASAPTLFALIRPVVVVIYDGTQASLSRFCRRMKVDVILPSMNPLENFGLPWAGYLFDCQHRYYPNFFSAHEINNRDRAFSHMLRTASVVVVNSHAVEADLNSFFPDKTTTIFSLPFAPIIRSENILSVIAETTLVKQKYATSDKYFIISNQFWIHKDHGTAIKAFAIVLQDASMRDYKLVCTGATEDYRFPGYFSELKNLISSLGLEDKIIFTGYIDKSDQLSLINGAALMLQPTLFEGGPGGGAVFDSVAFGVPSILSDIPVNLEINDSIVTFFKTGSPHSLASEIKIALLNLKARPTLIELLEKSSTYARKLGLSLLGVASSCIENNCTSN